MLFRSVSTTIGVERLTAITQWAEATGNKLFLGETGVNTDATSLTALDNMLTYMTQHSVWQGITYWAGGPWWGDSYWGSIEPANGVDKPQMTVMEQHLLPLFATVQHTADTVREIGDVARFQVRRLERLGNRIARLSALSSAVSRGVAVAITALLKKKEA